MAYSSSIFFPSGNEGSAALRTTHTTCCTTSYPNGEATSIPFCFYALFIAQDIHLSLIPFGSTFNIFPLPQSHFAKPSFLIRSQSQFPISLNSFITLHIMLYSQSLPQSLTMLLPSPLPSPLSSSSSHLLTSLPHLPSHPAAPKIAIRATDFRDIAGALDLPPLITNASLATNASATLSFFEDETWKSEWVVQNWNNTDSLGKDTPVFMVNTANNVYIERSNSSSSSHRSHLTLRTARHPSFQSVAEIVSFSKSYHQLSLRLLARVIGSPGACAGIFTYHGRSIPSSVQEADIEILTSDPRNRVHFTNQPFVNAAGNDVPQATVNSTVSSDGRRDWTAWNVFRFDWEEKRSVWFINGEKVAELAFHVPRDPSALILNMWSDGGVWTGEMDHFEQAYLQIQWIELVYNTSSVKAGGANEERSESGEVSRSLEKRKLAHEKGCEVVYGVDEMGGEIGTPVLLFNNTGVAMSVKDEAVRGMIWIPLVLVGDLVFGYL
ncbi:related to xyloglucan endo-transglycosylase-like protein [Rhynchosporium graminicola]|uniref:Related to xyloglucan endo-transglycosylase-like protein n=1 Tax=Rhynchosporium graminicola TaxID=2792576 RepID=A0A1E1K4N5_9HELO|nr:related to xyloglucan endo-transglycosylase-like protein [Rhynchosporium commune]